MYNFRPFFNDLLKSRSVVYCLLVCEIAVESSFALCFLLFLSVNSLNFVKLPKTLCKVCVRSWSYVTGLSQQCMSHRLYVFNNTRFFTVEVNRRCHICYNNLSTINIYCFFKSRYLTFISKGVKLTFSLILNCGLGITLDFN